MGYQIGDKVKVVKWRDNGWSAEVLYLGKVLGFVGNRVRVEISESRRGWKPGDVEIEPPANVLPG